VRLRYRLLEQARRALYRGGDLVSALMAYQRRGRCPVCQGILAELKSGVYRCGPCVERGRK